MMPPESQSTSSAWATPDATTDLQRAETVIDVFQRAAAASLDCSFRQGGKVVLPSSGHLLMTGDLHDHAPNYRKIVHLADLARSPDRHLVLHELIHGPSRVNGRDLSIRMLARVASLKLAFPEQVHILQANHDLAQYNGEGILKDGVSLLEAFDDGVEFIYGQSAAEVTAAMRVFIRSFLAAVQAPNGIFCCHSLPSPSRFDRFDPGLIDRVPTDEDLGFGGHLYNMVWGRNHTQALAEDLADEWNTRLFVMGHQPVEMGYETVGSRMLILASDHGHGVALPIDLSRSYELSDLVDEIVPLAGVTGPG